MSVTFYVTREQNTLIEMNVANSNARMIVTIVDDQFDYVGSLSRDQVREIALELLDPFARALNVRETTVDSAPGRATMIDCGIADWQLEKYANFFAAAYTIMNDDDRMSYC